VRSRRGTIRGGFTLVEILFSILIVFMLMGLLIAGIHYAMKTTRGTLDRQAVAALKIGVDQFKQEFGFFPALVKDMGDDPLNPTLADPLLGTPPSIPRVFALSTPADLSYLRGGAGPAPPVPDLRFSIYSLAYYVVGALDKDADGVQGPGFTAPTRDGGFTRKGPVFGPYFDTGRNAKAIYAPDARQGRIELRDSGGVAFRYYRWQPDAGSMPATGLANDFLNVPVIVGDPAEDAELRNAAYAIVGAGKDGLFGDEDQLPSQHPQYVSISDMATRLGMSYTGANAAEIRARAQQDNAVEVGR
jgi:type II secretory pathway pseudopilin PulG